MKYLTFLALSLAGLKAIASDFTDTASINTMVLANGWTGAIITNNSDLWIRSYDNGVGMYDYRIGAGGAVAEMRQVQSNNEDLLAGPFRSERTDRVIQEVWWGLNLVYSKGGAPDGRFNVNQAGNYADGNSPRPPNTLTPTVATDIIPDSTAPQIDVYSVPQDQWYPANDAMFTGKFSMLSRYKLIGNGWLMVRRVTVVGQILTNNLPANIRDLYIDAWTPFTKKVFNAMALSIDTFGNPLWWYQTGYNIPSQSAWPSTATHGYAVAFSASSHATKTAIGFVFGNSPPQWYTNQVGSSIGLHTFRCQEWSDNGGGLCFKPNLEFTFSIPAGTVIDDYYVIVPSPRMDSQFAADIASVEPLIPAPRFFWPGTVLDGELLAIVNRLNANLVNDVRTDKLGPLINTGE